ITIAAGVLFLNVPIDWSRVDWPLLVVTIILGVIMLAVSGLILAGITLRTARHSYYIGDVVAGGLFLFTGAIFPLEVLPVWLRPVGYFLPITYWLELIRRALVGAVADAFPTFSSLTNAHLMLILLGSSLVFGIASIFIFRACDHQAREKGLIDQVTNY
ncbi:MAG: ABC transporter permease, partial [Chloroflexota bacterium]